jgi:ABC-type branched-subunit amino acid transport system substrate-binding protein
MQHVIFAKAGLSRLKLCRFSSHPLRSPGLGARKAAGALALAALVWSAPVRAQSVAMIPAASARVETPGAAASSPCDSSRPDCPACLRAAAQGMARRAQHVAENLASPHAPDAAFGGLAEGKRALANTVGDDSAIRFGLIAPFTGANKDFASELKLGVETAFAAANEAGGVNGKYLRLIVADDGYDPTRTPDIAKAMVEKDHVFGFISNFGTATSAAILPYVLEHKLIFSGAFSGGGVLRREPPDRYVFNYRASYAEETEAVVRYLVKAQRLRPDQIAVFAQDDAFGDAGYAGVEKAIRALDDSGQVKVLHMRYARNTIDVAGAIEALRQHHDSVTTTLKKVRERVGVAKNVAEGDGGRPHPIYREKTVKVQKSETGIKAIVMVATYRAAAKFVEKARELYPDMIFTNVSAVGSNNFSEELKLLGPRFSKGVIVTQVTPDPEGYSSVALEYRAALNKYFPAEHPDYVSFESYLNAKILLEGLKKAGPQPDADKVVNALENIHALDLGLAAPVNFGASEHQAVHKVWGTMLDEEGRYHFIDLE